MMSELKSRLQLAKNHVISKQGELQTLKNEIQLKEKTEKQLQKDITTYTIEKKLIEEACSEAREQGKDFLEEISTIAVSSVFQDDTKVKLVLDGKNDAPVLDVKVTQVDENKQTCLINPNYDGGGLNDILSLSFLISIGSTIENNYAPLVLDEPSKYVSKGDLAKNFADYMKDVSSFTKKQIIMSTHDEAMLNIGDVRYHIEKNPETKVSEVTRVM